MKTLDEITRLTAEDLDRIGNDSSVPVPEELYARTEGTLRRLKRVRTLRRSALGAAAAVVLAVGIGLASRPEDPKDTFSDPRLAYAEVEKAFGIISDVMEKGTAALDQAETNMDKIAYWK